MQFVSRRMMLVGLAALGTLWPGVGLADDDDQGEDDGRGKGQGRPSGAPRGQGQVAGTSRFRLVPVSQVNGGNGGSDFSTGSPGSDGLSSGVVTWPGGNAAASVALRGAMPNSGYDVKFVHWNDHLFDDLGTINTDGNGNFTGQTPNGLGGNGQRVGTFVLNRGGLDQYVAVI
jgi:hypothetical protein